MLGKSLCFTIIVFLFPIFDSILRSSLHLALYFIRGHLTLFYFFKLLFKAKPVYEWPVLGS